MKNRLAQWLAARLPKRVVYYATIRAGAFATTGPYGDTLVPDVTFMEVLSRYHREVEGVKVGTVRAVYRSWMGWEDDGSR